ncbi:extracellular solute-binding protein [Actinoplanes sp. NPDC026670]|uniref:ABC transporter substrate-binding protein n=1 Tax=Actinoplanes sp. NPDC026670 TaxID=3154700 RepID=UPI00340B4FEB
MRILAAAAAALTALTLGAGCSGTQQAADPGCEKYAEYAGNVGSTVSVFSTIRGLQSEQTQQSWTQFEDCTGIDIQYTGSAYFESELRRRVQNGAAPDLALFPQPGLLADLVRSGKMRPAPATVQANVTKWFSPDWSRYGTVDGVLYAAPFTASVKSYVWYSPKMFGVRGLQVPTTWAEMITVSDAFAAEGVKPWCLGIESGSATGWPVTDWVEDVMLREFGADVYDQWVGHQIPFNDPRVVTALDKVGQIVRNPEYVYGDPAAVVATSFKEAGLPIMEGKCAMLRHGSSYADMWPKNAKVAPDGDVFAFQVPPIDPAKGRQLLVAGEFVGAFNDRPEVQAVAAYLSTADWANSRGHVGGAVSANSGFDLANAGTAIEKLSAELLTDRSITARFDGSDMMPAKVGTGTFWTGMTDWINGASTTDTLNRIESTWPR